MYTKNEKYLYIYRFQKFSQKLCLFSVQSNFCSPRPLQSGEATVQPDDVGDVEPVELEPGAVWVVIYHGFYTPNWLVVSKIFYVHPDL